MNSDRIIVIHNFISDEDMENINKHLVDTHLSKIEYENDITNKKFNYYEKIKTTVSPPSRWVARHDNTLVYELLDEFIPSVRTEIEGSFSVSVFPETAYSIHAYSIGDELPAHYDGDGSVPTPNGNPKRDISSILYLNEDFHGGEVFFQKQAINIKPKPGMLVVFPSTREFVHSVSKVESGFRYTIPQFWSISEQN
jgi:hypothetical protein